MDSINKAFEIHKEIFHSFLTRFAFLDTMISFNIASYFQKTVAGRIEITVILLADINSQKQFDILTRILKKRSFSQEDIDSLNKKYRSVRKLRNLLAHSFLIPVDNLKFNGKSLTLTKLSDSKGKGYRENLQINEVELKKQQLEDLITELHNMNIKYIKEIKANS